MKKHEAKDKAVLFREINKLQNCTIDMSELAASIGITIDKSIDMPNFIAGQVVDRDNVIVNNYINTFPNHLVFGNVVEALLVSAILLGYDKYTLYIHSARDMQPHNHDELMIFIFALNLLLTDDDASKILANGYNISEDPIHIKPKYDDDFGKKIFLYGVTERFAEIKLYQAGLLSKAEVLSDRMYAPHLGHTSTLPNNYAEYIDMYIIDDEPSQQDDFEWEEFDSY